MSRNKGTAGSPSSPDGPRRRRAAARRPLNRLFRPSGFGGLRGLDPLESLEDRLLLTAPDLLLGQSVRDRAKDLAFVDGAGPVVIVPDVAALDAHAAKISSATFTVVNAADDKVDGPVLADDPTFPEEFHFGAGSSVVFTSTQTVKTDNSDPMNPVRVLQLNLMFAAPLDATQALDFLKTVTYSDTIDPLAPIASPARTISVTVTNDAAQTSLPANAPVDFKSLNTQPSGGAAPLIVPVNDPALPDPAPTPFGFTASSYDPRDEGQTLTYVLTGLPTVGKVFLGATPIVAVPSAALTPAQFQSLTFLATKGVRGTGTLTFDVIDNGGKKNAGSEDTLHQSLAVTVNSPPVITLGSAALSASNPYPEMNPATNPLGEKFLAPDAGQVAQLATPGGFRGGKFDATVTATASGGAAGAITLAFDATVALDNSDNTHLNKVLVGGVPIGTLVSAGGTSVTVALDLGSPTSADVSALLQRVKYVNTSPDPTSAVTVTYTIDNGHGGGAASSTTTLVQNVTVHRINNPPVLNSPAGPTAAVPALKGQKTHVVGFDATHLFQVSDLDGRAAVEKVTFGASHGVLSFPAGPLVMNNGTSAVTVQGTLAEINAVISQGADYTSSGSYLGADAIVVTADDLGNTGDDGAKTDVKSVSLVVNSPPTITLGAGALGTASADQFPEKNPATNPTGTRLLAPAALAAQTGTPDAFEGGRLDVGIDRPASGADPLGSLGAVALDTTGSVTVDNPAAANPKVSVNGKPVATLSKPLTGNDTTLSFSFNLGPVTSADVSALLQRLKYVNASADPTAAVAVTYTLDNGIGGGAALSATTVSQPFTVHRINTPPVLNIPDPPNPAIAVLRGNAKHINGPDPAHNFQLSDPDGRSGVETVTFSVTHGTLSFVAAPQVTNNGTSVVIVQGTIAQINAVIGQGLDYTSTGLYLGADAISVIANDNGNTGDAPDNAPGTDVKSVPLDIRSGVTVSADVTIEDVNGNHLSPQDARLVGEPFVYVITVTNSGTVPTDVTVTDTLPANVTPTGPVTFSLTVDPAKPAEVRKILVTPTASAGGTTIVNALNVTPVDTTVSPPVDVVTKLGVGYVKITASPDSTGKPTTTVKEDPVTPPVVTYTVSLVAPVNFDANPPKNFPFNRSVSVTVTPTGTAVGTGPQRNYTASANLSSPFVLSDAKPSDTFTITVNDNKVIQDPVNLVLTASVAGLGVPGDATQVTQTLTILDADSNALVVTKTTDDNTVGTLRFAVATANNTPVGAGNLLRITFAFAAGTTNTIALDPANGPLTALVPLIIDAAQNQNVVVDGGKPGADYNGLTITAAAGPKGGVVVHGLTFQNFRQYGLSISPGASGAVVTGDTFQKNALGGLRIDGASGNTIGGPTADAGNVLIDNSGSGVLITGGGATDNFVQGNRIGVDPSDVAHPNADYGVLIDLGASRNVIGVPATPLPTIDAAHPELYLTPTRTAGNRIEFNGKGGVRVKSGVGDTVVGNSFAKNATAVATDPKSIILDAGANNNPAAPTLLNSATFNGTASIQGTIAPDATHDRRIDFYANPRTVDAQQKLVTSPDAKLLVWSITLPKGSDKFSPSFKTTDIVADQSLTATVTDDQGNTSVLASPILVTDGLHVTTTKDLIDPTDPNSKPFAGSLRAALLNALSQPALVASAIFFDLKDVAPSAGPWVFKFDAELPAISREVTIDGFTASPGSAVPKVVLDGSGNDPLKPQSSAFHFVAGADGSVLRGLVIQNFAGAGVSITGGGGYSIAGNYIGTTADGSAKGGNKGEGVRVDGASSVTIGGASRGDGNVISGNALGGVVIVTPAGSTGAYTVENNLIGVDSSGLNPVGDGGDGVSVDASRATAGARPTVEVRDNVVAANSGYGVHVLGAGAAGSSAVVVAGNTIGLSLDRTKAMENTAGGVLLDHVNGAAGSPLVTVGGPTDADANVIGGAYDTSKNPPATPSSPARPGLTVTNSSYVVITRNTVGLAKLGNNGDGVFVGSSSNVDVTGNQITGNAGHGLELVGTSAARVAGNFVGVDTFSKTSAGLSNLGDGVLLSGSTDALVGPASTFAGNVIAGNALNGVEVAAGSLNASVRSNAIGTDFAGTAVIGNGRDGVLVSGVTGRADTPGATVDANKVSFNKLNGVEVNGATYVSVSNNTLKGNAAGSAGTDGDGVLVQSLSSSVNLNNNVIQASGRYGIEALGATGLQIARNKVGTNAAGANDAALGNTAGGIHLKDGSGVTVGGTDGSAKNLVSGNHGDGLTADGVSSLVVRYNTFGLDDAGNGDAPNSGDGVDLSASAGAVIDHNLIASSGGYGVRVAGSNGVQVTNNLIGTGVNGAVSHPNTMGGVILGEAAAANMTGGSVVGNTISGNGGAGVTATNTPGLSIVGNRIGVSFGTSILATGSFAVPNAGDGIHLSGAPDASVRGNLIGGNRGDGVDVSSSDRVSFTGNFIGTDASSSAPVLGNTSTDVTQGDGIKVLGSAGVTIGVPDASIGQTVDDARNVIANNGRHGIEILQTTPGSTLGVRIANNRIGVVPTGSVYIARGNAKSGISVSGGATVQSITNNVIGGNRENGVEVLGTSAAAGTSVAAITGNFIGTNDPVLGPLGNKLFDPGAFPLGNILNGVYADAGSTLTLGDDQSTDPTAGRNFVEYNLKNGVLINGATATLVGNVIGSNQNLAGQGEVGAGVNVESSDGVALRQNTIVGNLGDGVYAHKARGLTLSGNGIGTDTVGVAVLGNRSNGVQIVDSTGVVVGSNGTSGLGNFINNNGQNGVRIEGASAGVVVGGNWIGLGYTLAPDGTKSAAPAGNVQDGVSVTSLTKVNASPSTFGALLTGNTVVNNFANGIEVAASGSNPATVRIEGNLIGTTGVPGAAGTVNPANQPAFGNRLDGVKLDGAQGVLLQAANLIANNRGHGVEFTGGAANNTASADVIVLNGGNGVQIGGGATNNAVVGNDIGDFRFIGFYNSGAGVSIAGASSNRVEGNRITGNLGSGVLISKNASANKIFGNQIGGLVGGSPVTSDPPVIIGYVATGNHGDGVSLVGAGSKNEVRRNVITGNNNSGLLVSGGTASTVVDGNLIGTTAAAPVKNAFGTVADFGNAGPGVAIIDSPSSVLQFNVISGNHSHGVQISGPSSSGNLLVGNVIGPWTGDGRTFVGLGNALTGVVIIDAPRTVVTGGNVISGNQSHGVFVIGAFLDPGTPVSAAPADGNVISRNYIGTVPGGTVAASDLANKGDGVVILDSSGNVVGGATDADRNVISQNAQSGVDILGVGLTADNMILRNLIGTDSARAARLGNKLDGVTISGVGAVGTVVTGNRVVNNTGNGVRVNGAVGTVLAGNLVGVTAAGSTDDYGNVLDGISLNSAVGTRLDPSNEVAYNHVDGLGLFNSYSTVVAGTVFRSNQRDGVRIEELSRGNLIGLPDTAATGGLNRNYIYANAEVGVEVRTGATMNLLQNNVIGLDQSHRPVAGQPLGVNLNHVSGNVVGPAALGADSNTVTGNTTAGVRIEQNSKDTPSSAPSDPTNGNFVRNNFVGTDANGERLTTPAGLARQDLGLFLVNSADNTIAGNVLSGNVTAGVEVFGAQSNRNRLFGNTIGSNRAGSVPVLPADPLGVTGAASYAYYSEAVRQDSGVLINNASGNVIGFDGWGVNRNNTILGNYFGVRIVGANATDNFVAGNRIGPAVADPGDKTSGLANFFGVSIDNTSRNRVWHNVIDGNISVGVALVGANAQGNWVSGNDVSFTGGYGDRLDATGAPSAAGVLIHLGAPVVGREIFGSGIYLESAQNNIIGSSVNGPSGPAENVRDRNVLIENRLVGIYLFANADNNAIRSNLVIGRNHPKGAWNGDYGILFFNSAVNRNNLLLANRSGPFSNVLQGNRVADFREFTGSPNTPPDRVKPPTLR